MIISEKQIMRLMTIAASYIEILGIINSMNIGMNFSKELVKNATNLLNEIAGQQSEELKEIK